MENKLTVDGVEYALVYDFNRIADVEEEADCNLLLALTSVLGGKATARQLRGLLFASIIPGEDGRQMTLAHVGKLVRPDTLVPVYEALRRAFEIAIAQEKVG